MLQKLKTKLLPLAAVFSIALASMAGSAAPAFAATTSNPPDITNATCTGAANLQIPTDGSTTDCNTLTADANGAKVNSLLATVINIFSVIVGVIAVIMIIIGGFRYVTSGGQSEKITSAKNTILYALIGLIIVALAQVIVKFVLNKATAT